MEAMTEERLARIAEHLRLHGEDSISEESVLALLAEVRRLRAEVERLTAVTAFEHFEVVRMADPEGGKPARYRIYGLRADGTRVTLDALYLHQLSAAEERVKALEVAAQGLLGARDGLAKARLDDVGPLGVHEALEVVMAAERSLRALLAARV